MNAVPRQRISWPSGAWGRAWRDVCAGSLWEGPAIERLEQRLATLLGVEHAAAVPSGRIGLSLVLESLELAPGSEVICPAFGYPAVPWVVEQLGLRVRFADCELGSLGMDPRALHGVLSSRTGAVIAAHLFGVPCRIREIAGLAAAASVPLIEDCAHTLCASAGGRPVGTFGRAGYFSFETSKLVNTFGGGLIATRDAKLAGLLRTRLRAQPRNGPAWLLRRLVQSSLEALATRPLPFRLLGRPLLQGVHRLRGAGAQFASGYKPDEISLQGRRGQYTNFQAELGLAQLDLALAALPRRRANAAFLRERVGHLLPFQRASEPDAISDDLLCTTRVPDLERACRLLLELGVDTKHHYMRDCGRLFGSEDPHANAARAEREVLHVPAYPELDDAQLAGIAGALVRVAHQIGVRERGLPTAGGLPALVDVG